jgi:large subunit ribosomal protein L27
MAHKKAGGSKARQRGNVAGKRMGVKISGGSSIKSGQIIIRQRGRDVIPGENTMMGKDFTIFAVADGIVTFKWKTKKKKAVEVKA